MSSHSWITQRGGRSIAAVWALVFFGASAKAVLARRAAARAARAKQARSGELADAADGDAAAEAARRGEAKRRAKVALNRMIALLRNRDGRMVWYCALLSAALCARSFTAMKMYRQIGVLGALLARRDWSKLSAAQVRRGCLLLEAGFDCVCWFSSGALAGGTLGQLS